MNGERQKNENTDKMKWTSTAECLALNGVRSVDSQRELRVEYLLLHGEEAQLRWLRQRCSDCSKSSEGFFLFFYIYIFLDLIKLYDCLFVIHSNQLSFIYFFPV